MPPIQQALRRRVAQSAHYRCGYCQTQESVIGMPLEIEHIIPQALGGESTESNLWLACPRCNRYKGARTSAVDPLDGVEVPLYDPRRQPWHEHFVWRQTGLVIEGITPTGRATVEALQLNNSFIIRARRHWIAVGWHPPADLAT